MNDALVASNSGGLAEVVAHVGLTANPNEIAAKSFSEIDLRRVTSRTNPIRPADEMPHFSGTKFAVNLWLDLNSERIGNSLRDLAHSHAFAAADVHRQAVEHVGFSGEQVRARDILDE